MYLANSKSFIYILVPKLNPTNCKLSSDNNIIAEFFGYILEDLNQYEKCIKIMLKYFIILQKKIELIILLLGINHY